MLSSARPALRFLIPGQKQAHVTCSAQASAADSFPDPHLGVGVGPTYGPKSTLSPVLCFRDFEQHHQTLQCKLPAVVAGMVGLNPS